MLLRNRQPYQDAYERTTPAKPRGCSVCPARSNNAVRIFRTSTSTQRPPGKGQAPRRSRTISGRLQNSFQRHSPLSSPLPHSYPSSPPTVQRSRYQGNTRSPSRPHPRDLTLATSPSRPPPPLLILYHLSLPFLSHSSFFLCTFTLASTLGRALVFRFSTSPPPPLPRSAYLPSLLLVNLPIHYL
jgi:hypothetical protein